MFKFKATDAWYKLIDDEPDTGILAINPEYLKMDELKLEQLALIIDEIATNRSVQMSTLLDAKKLASEDTYLYDLLLDWAKASDSVVRDMYLSDILTYTEEKLRLKKV